VWVGLGSKLTQLFVLVELVEAGYDVNQADAETVTLLHWAAINNRRDIINYLVSKGSVVDVVGGELQATPLHWATRLVFPADFRENFTYY